MKRSGFFVRALLAVGVAGLASAPALAATPHITISSPIGGSTVPGSDVTIGGNAPSGSAITVTEGSKILGNTTSSASTAWSIVATLSDGLHTVEASGTDAGGAPLQSATRNFAVDATAPSAPVIDTPAASAVLNPGAIAVSGTAEPASWVIVRENGTEIGTQTATDDGAWSVSSSFSEGDHTISVTATDAAGNISAPATRTFSVHPVPPSTPVILTPDEGATVNAVFVHGSADPGATVAISDGATPLGNVSAGANGSWSLQPALPEGAHVISAVASGPGGTSGAATRSFTVDTSAPGAPQIVTPAEGALLGVRTVTFNGTSDPGTQVIVRDTGVVVGTAFADGSGNWSFSAQAAEGHRTVTATATDSAGNTGAATTRSFTVDTTAPDAPVFTSPAQGAMIGAHAVLVSGTAEPGANVTISEATSRLGTATSSSSGMWSIALDLADNEHALSATTTDLAGNTGASAQRSFTVDTTAPAAPVITSPEAGASTNERPLTIEGTAESGAHIAARDGSDAIASATAADDGTWSITSSLADGAHTISVVATDAAGNTGTPATRSFTIDTVAPDAPVIASPREGEVISETRHITIEGTREAGAAVTITLNGRPFASIPDGDTTWSFSKDLADGDLHFGVRATDAAGNVSEEATRNIRLDTVPPSVTITTPNLSAFGPGSSRIDGTALDIVSVAAVSVEVRDLAGGIVTTQAATLANPGGTSTTWSVKLTPALPGVYAVQAIASDAVGHTATSSAVTIVSLG